MQGDLDFGLVANNDCAIDCYIRRKSNKLPLNLDGCTVRWQMHDNGNPVITKESDDVAEILVFDQSLEENIGRLRLYLTPDDTVDLQTDREYEHEFVIIDSDGKVLNVTEDDRLLTVGKVWLRRQYTVQPSP